MVLRSSLDDLKLFMASALANSTLLCNEFCKLGTLPPAFNCSSDENELSVRSYFSPYSLAFLKESSLLFLYIVI